jgi:S1-C subfamily serine protease
VSAELIGNEDQLLEAGVLTANVAPAEVAYIEYYDHKKDEPVASVLPPDADYKVDKADAPCVDTMLRQAERETASDLEQNTVETSVLQQSPSLPKGKSDGLSCPLSMATRADKQVHNDILKVIMVGAANVDKSSISWAIRQTSKKPKKRASLGVDLHVWSPTTTTTQEGKQVKFSIWDVQGSSIQDDGCANAGAHPGTQSLFFSPKSLYLLVWDLAVTNTKTIRRKVSVHHDDDDENDDEEENEFFIEEANRRADGALQSDIKDRVLSWVDCIARRGPNSAILPVALIPDGMDPTEARRRCSMMQSMLGQHILQFDRETTAPKLLVGGQDSVVCVKFDDDTGISQLQETIIAIATDVTHSVFDHVGTQVPSGTVQVLDVIRHLKGDHKVILLDHLLAELSPSVSVEEAVEALIFLSSIGELLYFGGSNNDEILARYIILSRKWLVSALTCILRNDWKRELEETRRFMKMQCLYSNQEFPENEVCKTLMCGNDSSCPVLSSADSAMLWQTKSFMREAADRSAQLSEDSATSSTMFDFLEHLLVQSGLLVPLQVSHSINHDEVFFVPSLLIQSDPVDVWTFKSLESWNTTLCDSWLFRDGAPLDLMEHLMVTLLRNIYEFSRLFPSVRSDSAHRVRTCPLRLSSMNEFTEDHDGSAIGRIKIHQIMCWKSSLYVKIGCAFADGEAHEIRESSTEIFVTLVDQSSVYCVSADAMRSNMQRLVVSGKGQVGCHGRKLWKGGYSVVLKSINETLRNFSNVDRQVVCPECLAHANPSSASTWSWDSVQAAAGSGNATIRCMRGHRVDSNLICGTLKRQELLAKEDNLASQRFAKVPELLKSVVVVGLYDARQKKIISVGSGFIVDKKLGLIVTAGHILFNMDEGRQFGTPFFGGKLARAVIGIIPDKGQNAVFRYYADVVAHDIHNMDACVLRIVSRMEDDVGDGDACGDQPEIPLLNDQGALQQEDLQPLKLTRHFELEENIRVLGFNQGGEGLLEKGKHVNLSADFAKGYICKKFRPQVSDDSSSSSDSSRSNFAPREEIVIMCSTISGHSGGPCVNDEGKVVGILSRADPVERQRCYLVPTSEVKLLVNKAKEICLCPMNNSYR